RTPGCGSVISMAVVIRAASRGAMVPLPFASGLTGHLAADVLELLVGQGPLLVQRPHLLEVVGHDLLSFLGRRAERFGINAGTASSGDDVLEPAEADAGDLAG